jgi:hypothetical protein
MELITQPDIYSPSMDDQGNYIDRIPQFNIIKKGVYCPCGSRKDKAYDSTSAFSTHIKTKCHQKWLISVNQNKVNMYIDNETLKETVQNQRLAIAKMEKDLQTKVMTIDYLTIQLTKQNQPTITVSNLLDL